MPSTPPRIAIAHDYLTQRGGAERVVLAMSRAFPDATIYTTLYDPQGTFPEFADRRIVSSPLNRIGMFRRDHRKALPLLPLASALVRPDAEVVIASSSGWAHGFAGRERRVVYCHSPARWLYLTDEYLGGPARRGPKGRALLVLRPFLMAWDKRKARRPATYLANSHVVAERIRRVYGRTASVVPAPVTDHAVSPDPIDALADWEDGGWFLVVSRLMPYKNVDKVIEAVRGTRHRLVVVGSGPEARRLQATAPDNVIMMAGLTDAQMTYAYANARALIAPSFEDYGLTPLEAGLQGTPTLALQAGGYLDTIEPGVNGAFFGKATADQIRAAIERFDPAAYRPDAIQAHVSQFSEQRFAQRLRDEVARLVG